MTHPTPDELLRDAPDLGDPGEVRRLLAACGAHSVPIPAVVVDAALLLGDAVAWLGDAPDEAAVARWLGRVEELDLAAKACAGTPALAALGEQMAALVDAACAALPSGPAVDRALVAAADRGVRSLRPWSLLSEPRLDSLLPAWLAGKLGAELGARMGDAVRTDRALGDAYRALVLPRLAELSTCVVTPAWDPGLERQPGDPPVERVPIPHSVAGSLAVFHTSKGAVVQLPSGDRTPLNPGPLRWHDDLLGDVQTEVSLSRNAALDRRFGLTALGMVLDGELGGRSAGLCVRALALDLERGVLSTQLTEAAMLAESAMRGQYSMAGLHQPREVVKVPVELGLVRALTGGEGAIDVVAEARIADEELKPATHIGDCPPARSTEAFAEEWAWLALATRAGLQRVADEGADCPLDRLELLELLGAIDDLHERDGPALFWISDSEWARLTRGIHLERAAWWAWGAEARGRPVPELARSR